MKLLEKQSQDIKSLRKFKPCAPKGFRWVVVGLYSVIVVISMVWGGVSVHSSYVSGVLNAQQKKNDEVAAQIEKERSRTVASQQSKVKYDSFQAWLKKNYSMTQLLNSIFGALPENVRLREFDVEKKTAERFDMRLNLFSLEGGEVPSFEGFTAKLENVGIYFENTSQSAAEGIQMSCSFNLPERFYPALAPQEKANSTESLNREEVK